MRPVLRATNGGQASAYAEAWPLSRGEIVIFLDGDDVLEPYAASTVARHWRPGLAKLQFQLVTIDEAGRIIHDPWPTYPAGLDAAQMRELLLTRGSYPSVPSCGNAYARTFLERRGEPAVRFPWWDIMLEIDAPFLGEVDSLIEPLARKREHGAAGSLSAFLAAGRFERLQRFFEDQLAYLAARAAAVGLPFDVAAARRRSAWHQDLELVLARLGRRPGSSAAGRLPAAALATLGTMEPARKKLALLAWEAAVALAPAALAGRALAWRFLPAMRPSVLRPRDPVADSAPHGEGRASIEAEGRR